MSLPTFSYDQDQVTNILSRVTVPVSFLTVPSEELRSRDYEKELRKQTALELHCGTLAEYHKAQRIPRGLRVQLRPTVFSDNPEYCTKYESILNKCSMDIIVLTIEYLQKEITELTPKIHSIEDQLSNTLSTTEWDKLKLKTKETIAGFQKTLQDRKRLKFIRDQEDYARHRVYRWRFMDFNSTRRPNYNRYSASSSSDSESYSSNSSRFLDTRQHPGGRQGGVRGRPNPSYRIQTRSQGIPV
ncbi:uncharacterized protein LOC142260821 [Anomaloglossus baeobatrachus]|uniref:uncharacterized protein LOC142260821 n=1 Tax=Anomaloglossus baeobatrachus TaxID=238106 RepID=UPI003F504DE4